nr:FAD-binding oxidoreductase [Granulosicoccus sp.]
MTDVAVHHSHLNELAQRLSSELEGECDFSDAGVALYTSDASNYRQIPLGVVYPGCIDDIVLATNYCKELELPVLMRGGGTSQNGQCVNEAVIIDCSRHLQDVLEINEADRSALIQPGIICDSLKAAAEKKGLTFGPDPATHSRCTLGGMIGNNSCGPRSMLAGKTVENVLELEVLTSDGARFWTGPTSEVQLQAILAKSDRQAQIYQELIDIRDTYADLIRQRYPNIKRRVSGYNLDQLLPENGFNVARALVGSEGTCVSVLQARVRLIEKPHCTALTVLGFRDIFDAGDAVRDILPFSPTAMEGLDWNIVGGLIDRQLRLDEVALLPEGRAWVLVELAASDTETLKNKQHEFVQEMNKCACVLSVLTVSSNAEEAALWSIREQGASATSMSLDPNGVDPIVGWEDTAVDPLQLGDYLREFQALVDRYDYSTSLYGHFGDGCIHARITFDTRTHDGVTKWRQFSQEIAKLVVRFGGSLSGEHGDGQAKAEFLPIMFGEELMQAFQRFKLAWDPQRRMNPGKLIDAYRMDENLRFGPDYQTPQLSTTLVFSEDPKGFGRSTERCIGMGKCRAETGAMCPSYQATGKEIYSTRGRAHLLHEMARGEIITDSWQHKTIADSMAHCLSCKACKSECPTQVDIASYKAEFLAKHHASIRRPVHHYVTGFLGRWLPLAATAPRLFNWMQNGPAGKFLSAQLGFSNEKTLPLLATTPFKAWAKRNAHKTDNHFFWFGQHTDPEVILWVDSVNAHYRPAILQSAINVLTHCGYQVGVARQNFCCGRPLYEYGFLTQARQQLLQILEGFHSHLPDDASVLVMEPSCLSVFKDELGRLFPNDDRAAQLMQKTRTLGNFLGGSLDSTQIKLQKTLTTGYLHAHCHSRALDLTSAERELMSQCFDNLEESAAGCCGMAGTYGLRQSTRPFALK